MKRQSKVEPFVNWINQVLGIHSFFSQSPSGRVQSIETSWGNEDQQNSGKHGLCDVSYSFVYYMGSGKIPELRIGPQCFYLRREFMKPFKRRHLQLIPMEYEQPADFNAGSNLRPRGLHSHFWHVN